MTQHKFNIPTHRIRDQLNAVESHSIENTPTRVKEPIPVAAIEIENTPVLQLTKGNLIPEGFEFDDSQIEALKQLATQTHGCLIGAAGTGKTTCTKAFVQSIANEVRAIDADYASRKANGNEHREILTPSILLCSFTGKAVRQIRKNFPNEWHRNIMTIHRALRYAPEMVDSLDEEGNIVTKRIFTPTHTAANKMPWDVIIVDETSMLALDLWRNFLAAMKDETRIYMVGDLNQLTPVQGRSIFGYALSEWNTVELTHVHRQKDSQDCIVPNAHRILAGLPPEEGYNVKMRPLSQDARTAAQQVIAVVKKLHSVEQFNPNYDALITAVNGDKWESPSAPIGQIPLNDTLALYFNQSDEEGNPRARYMIDAGRTRKVFAVGDKVMATKNDYANNITNGMTGIIIDISENRDYIGDRALVGHFDKVQAVIESQKETLVIDHEQLQNDLTAASENSKKVKEPFLKGVASHTVTVDFHACEIIGADDDLADDAGHVNFRTRGEVESLQLAYASTCHKMQGSECPTTIVICHEVFGRMLSREWLYTACTRASEKLLILYTQRGLQKALANQRIKGSTIAEKTRSFQELMEQQRSNGNANNIGNTIFKSLEVKLPTAQTIPKKETI